MPSEATADEDVTGWDAEDGVDCSLRQAALMADLSKRDKSEWSGSRSVQMVSKPARDAEHAAKVSTVQPAMMRLDVMPGGTPHSPKRLSRTSFRRIVSHDDSVVKGNAMKYAFEMVYVS